MAADSSSSCADSRRLQQAATSASAADLSPGEHLLQQELATLREQYNRKQQEVVLLQAQVERLSSVLDGSNDEVRGFAGKHLLAAGQTLTRMAAVCPQEAAPASSAHSSSTGASTHMQQQLHAARAELHQTQTLLQQLMHESAAAVKAACDQRCGALRLLLAEKLQELQECEQQRAAAQQLADAKASLRHRSDLLHATLQKLSAALVTLVLHWHPLHAAAGRGLRRDACSPSSRKRTHRPHSSTGC